MDDARATGSLVAWYRRHIGEPERRVDVYLGFALFFGGLGLGLSGLALFVYEGTLPGPGKTYWFREIAFAVGASGLPTLLLGVTVLLPVERRARYAALGGATICLVAVALFVGTYPYQWDVRGGPDYSVQGVGIYAVGLVAVVAATAAALVSYHVERALPTESGDETSPDPEVPDEQVRHDIDDALASAELSWGGVRKVETQRIQFGESAATESIDRSGLEGVAPTSHRSEGVDGAVAGLKRLRGNEDRTARGGGTDDQTAALRQLRERQASGPETPPSLVERLRGLLRQG
ncbi:permease [Halomarina halobia]|uniref:Permease n=1 Tax=Halomarina halobia TaxID=3033386 RepID=A0ABD6A6A3_9EURY|nr:permease [Halomarina sp. PSR21]